MIGKQAMMKLLIALTATLLLTQTAAMAQEVFDDGGSHTVNTTINNFVYVFNGPGSTPTTVTFDAGTNIR